MLALWVSATVEGVGNARKLARLSREHDAFRWLCESLPVDYHFLSDSRNEHQESLNKQLIQIVATLLAQDLVTLAEAAQRQVERLAQESERTWTLGSASGSWQRGSEPPGGSWSG